MIIEKSQEKLENGFQIVQSGEEVISSQFDMVLGLGNSCGCGNSGSCGNSGGK